MTPTQDPKPEKIGPTPEAREKSVQVRHALAQERRKICESLLRVRKNAGKPRPTAEEAVAILRKVSGQGITHGAAREAVLAVYGPPSKDPEPKHEKRGAPAPKALTLINGRLVDLEKAVAALDVKITKLLALWS